jgi:hypothetical protein
MSRWAEAFAALSKESDTLDTTRHSEAPPAIVSQSVQSVTAAPAPPEPLPEPMVAPSWDEAEEERAAIVEHDGAIPRAWAEGFARLRPERPLADVSPKRWQQFIDDIGRFLDAGWAEKASALGWGPLDLFGCDRERPFARLDHAGLLWLLNGDGLAELDCHRAVVERSTGSPQVFRRRPLTVGEVVLAWELVA